MKLVARWWLEESTRTWMVEDNVITGSEPNDEPASMMLAPAFHDIQVNGSGGVAFTSDKLQPEDVGRVVKLHQAQGTGSFFPTVITASCLTMLHSLQTLKTAIESNPHVASACPGLHLEGPMISPVDGYRGAHPKEHVRPLGLAEFAEFQEACGGRIRLVTLAPEVPGAIALIEKLVGEGVQVSLGHTQADAAVIRAAVEAGAAFSTHLGNGIAENLHRHDNPIWHQLGEDRLTASMIADGHHLPANVVRAMARAKNPHFILISDASSYAGCPPGVYQDWGSSVEVSVDQRVSLMGTPYLAGSGVFLRQCVEWAIRNAMRSGCAVAAAGQTPYWMFGLPWPKNWVLVDAAGQSLEPERRGLLDATRVVESVP
jgi:N-acetylglucosamine-6-phosphate deacetylase